MAVPADALDELGGLAEVPVYLGGPVSTEQLTFASMTWREETETLDYETHLSSEDAAHRMQEGFSIRASTSSKASGMNGLSRLRSSTVVNDELRGFTASARTNLNSPNAVADSVMS